jgi:hypothetical protein
MAVTKIDWVALKIADDSLETSHAFGKALGLITLMESPTQVMMQTPDGGVVEFCSNSYEGPEHLFARQNTVFGFGVTDILTDGAQLVAAGFKAVTEPTDGGPVLFQHFLGPDGRNYGLIQHK